MQLKVPCPACGKKLRLGEHESGKRALCPACGGTVEVPPAPLLGPLRSDTGGSTPLAELDLGDGDPSLIILEVIASPESALATGGVEQQGAAASASLPESAPVPPRRAPAVRRRGKKGAADDDATAARERDRVPLIHIHPAYGLVGAAAACVLISVAALAAMGRFQSWEERHRGAMTALKGQAETAANEGRLDEAVEAYRQLDELVDGRQMRDPALRELADAARTNRNFYAGLIERARAAEKVAVGPPPSPQQQAPQVSAAAPATPVPSPKPTDTAAPVGPLAYLPPTPGPTPTPNPQPARPDAELNPPAPPATKPAPPTPPAVDGQPGASAGLARALPKPAPADHESITDERIGVAIQKGVDYLLAQFDPKTHRLAGGAGDGERGGFRRMGNDDAYAAGMDALAVYALLQSGQAINDPRLNVRGATMKYLIDAMKLYAMDGHYQTYARGIRATCLALFDRPEDLKTLQDDADYLLGTCLSGAYSYNAPRTQAYRRSFTATGRGWDNSNSQYGLLGVWSAIDAEPSIEVPGAYWRAVEHHWTQCQLDDGQWPYTTGGGGRLTMTCAGIASLLVAHEYLDPPLTSLETSVGREPFSPSLKKGLDWFERGDHSVDLRRGNWWGYALYGVERVGLASGFKHFGRHDWYRELAEDAVTQQGGNGSWGSGVVDTSYALLFLARGRHPILMNKLRFDRRGDAAVQYWSNRPRDLGNAARFATRQLERPINWQVVSIDNPWTDWMDSPILYIASHEPPKFGPEDYEKLRQYVEAGGMIFTHADAGSPAFNAWAADLAHQLFKQYEMADLPPDHPIYNVVFKPSPRPPLKAVTNGSRILMLHSPADLSLRWQQRQDRAWEGKKVPDKGADAELRAKQLAPFQFAVNLFIYAAGKRDLRNRLDSPWVGPVDGSPVQTVKVARLRYAGNWDPEPGAWRRFANALQRETSYRADVLPIKLTDLKPGDAPLAHLTGTHRTSFSASEAAALKAYVEAGGVVLIDGCGGPGPFDTEVRSFLSRAFPDRALDTIGPDHPLLHTGNPGMNDVGKPRLRPYTIERLGGRVGPINLLSAGKGHVIYTNLDVTTGLLGTGTWGVIGYDPTYCQQLVTNALLWTLDGQPDKR